MSTFIVRIELHPSDSEQDYSAVHDSMKTAGFSRIYRDYDGRRYHLPASEYFIAATETVEAIRVRASGAVSKVTTHFMVLASEASRIAIAGLVPVTEKTLPVLPAAVVPELTTA